MIARPKIGTKLRRNNFLSVHNSTNLSRSSRSSSFANKNLNDKAIDACRHVNMADNDPDPNAAIAAIAEDDCAQYF